jgi:transcriptional regulator with XRE-family HTH domain
MLTYDRYALKRLMTEHGFDPTTLSAQAGVARPTVIYLARGMTEPKATTLAKLANALHVEVGVFFKRRAA